MIKALFALFLMACSPAFAADYRVIDGDTIVLTRIKHRFWGVDAFELSQTCHDVAGIEYACGLRAKAHLEYLMQGAEIICTPTGVTSYNRSVSKCTADGLDLAMLMVEAGWAVDYPAYSRGKYRQAQSIAQVRQLGAHAGSFKNPREYRQSKKEF